jgi:hypothetical protein
MNTASRFVLPIALALSAGAALAEGPLQGNEVFQFQSTLSRAEVQAQAVAARDAGQLPRGEILPVQAEAGTPLSRAQVRAEAAEALRLGLIPHGEVLPVASADQREQIRLAGLRAAQAERVAQAR